MADIPTRRLLDMHSRDQSVSVQESAMLKQDTPNLYGLRIGILHSP